jgi:hypothetical protein
MTGAGRSTSAQHLPQLSVPKAPAKISEKTVINGD